jgi:glycine C-acetyltransferase
MIDDFLDHLRNETGRIHEEGTFKLEHIISTPQQARIVADGKEVINLCANNYLGLANHPALLKAAKESLDKYGYGMASVRFVCGTQTIHKELESAMSEFLGAEDTILYPSCYMANLGLFETLLGGEDAVIGDKLNHSSMLAGMWLSKASLFLYDNNDLRDLERQLKLAHGCRFKLIGVDGVFSIEGTLAKLPEIRSLADRYNAILMIDDSHGIGILGEKGQGSAEYHNLTGKIDIITGTLGKALGGAAGGFTSGRKEIIEWLRQSSRPYLLSNNVPPVIAAASLAALQLLRNTPSLREHLRDNSSFFRNKLRNHGFKLIPGDHPIIPIIINDETTTKQIVDDLFEEGVYVTSFSYPVVAKGEAKIRTQMSAAHTREDLLFALRAFAKVGRKHRVI